MAHWHDAVGYYARPDVVKLLVNRTKRGGVLAFSDDAAFRREPMVESSGATMQSLDELKSKISESGSPELLELAEQLEREVKGESEPEATSQQS